MVLEMVRTKDILGSARGEMGFEGVLMGFAAETEEMEAYMAVLDREGGQQEMVIRLEKAVTVAKGL